MSDVKEEVQYQPLDHQLCWRDQQPPFYGGEIDFGSRVRNFPELDIGTPANSNERGHLPKSLTASVD